MPAPDEVGYRLRLAAGFLAEARQDVVLQRWRSSVDNSQLATENAAKAVLALPGPVGRTHNPAALLREELARGVFASAAQERVRQLADCAEQLGPEVHVQSDYGDEAGGRTPWELFAEDDARRALTIAEEAVSLAKQIIRDEA